MRINNNIMALNAHRQLGANQAAGAKSMERLSSGLRINRAGDDAAGLAISEKMRGQIRGLKQAGRNAQDGISMIQTAEGALNETHSILQRMRELATQASNDTNVGVDRGEIQKEINNLTSELNRIGNTTEFNTQSLLKGGKGGPASGVYEFSVSSHGLSDTQKLTIDGVDLEFNSTLAAGKWNDAQTLVGAINNDATLSEKYVATHRGDTIVLTQKDGKETSFSPEVAANSVAVDVNTIVDGIASETKAAAVTFTANSADLTITAGLENAELGNITIKFTSTAGAAGAETASFNATGTELTVDLNSEATYTAARLEEIINLATLDSNRPEGLDMSQFEVTTIAAGTTGANIVTGATASGQTLTGGETAVGSTTFEATFQVGANAGQSMGIDIRDMRATSGALKVATASGETVESKSGKTAYYTSDTVVTNGTDSIGQFKALDVSDHGKASAAIDVINDAIEQVSAERSKLGAFQNRLEHTISNLGTSAENLQAAESRIRDLDMAEEMMAFTKNNILQQAATAMLAQANMAPQSVLQLLG